MLVPSRTRFDLSSILMEVHKAQRTWTNTNALWRCLSSHTHLPPYSCSPSPFPFPVFTTRLSSALASLTFFSHALSFPPDHHFLDGTEYSLGSVFFFAKSENWYKKDTTFGHRSNNTSPLHNTATPTIVPLSPHEPLQEQVRDKSPCKETFARTFTEQLPGKGHNNVVSRSCNQ